MEVKNLELTPELKKALNGYMAIDIDSTFRFTPDAFKALPDDKRPVFILREPSGEEIAELDDKTGYVYRDFESGNTKMELRTGCHRFGLLKFCVTGWENYFDTNGKYIPFSKDEIKRLPVKLQTDLQKAISARRSISEDEKRGLE